jgi:nucleoside-diphosphate-sugar epimerase
MKILITGGSGFIGTNLQHAIVNRGCDFISLDILPPIDPSLRASYVKCDLRNLTSTISVLKEFRPELIYHLAARTDLGGDQLEDYESNTIGTLNLIKAASLVHTNRIIFTSTQLVNKISAIPLNEYDVAPPNSYGRSKLVGESYFRLHSSDIAWTILRPTSVWGPWFGLKYQGLYSTIFRGTYRHFSDCSIQKRWSYVGNLINVLLAVATNVDYFYKTFYIADRESYNLVDYANQISQLSGSKEIRSWPLSWFKLASRSGDFLRNFNMDFPIYSYRLNNMLSNMAIRDHMDISLTINDAYSRKDAIKTTLDWMANYHNLCVTPPPNYYHNNHE